jgi:hypothetical protein
MRVTAGRALGGAQGSRQSSTTCINNSIIMLLFKKAAKQTRPHNVALALLEHHLPLLNVSVNGCALVYQMQGLFICMNSSL